MDALTDAAVSAAEEQVDLDALLPFAVVLLPDGSLELRASAEESATAESLIRGLTEGLQSEREALSGAALVYEVRLPDARDAIQVHLEHADASAPALLMALPFERTAAGVTVGSLQAARTVRRIWS